LAIGALVSDVNGGGLMNLSHYLEISGFDSENLDCGLLGYDTV
jgi:hypothetical protein